jgi:hypothetical protein
MIETIRLGRQHITAPRRREDPALAIAGATARRKPPPDIPARRAGATEDFVAGVAGVGNREPFRTHQ